MRFWGNLIGYEAVWFCTVLSVARGWLWPSLLATCLFVLWQLALSERRSVDMRLVALALACGLAVDGALAASGWLDYAGAQTALPPGGAPLWILALWAAFAMTLTQSLRYLQTHPLLAVALGAIGGPLAYLGAAHGWSVVHFVAPSWRALAGLILGWGIATPLLAGMARRWSRRASRTRPWLQWSSL